MANGIQAVYEQLVEINGRLSAIEGIIPTVNDLNRVVIVGNHEKPLKESVRELVKCHDDEVAEKIEKVKEEKAAKIKLEEEAKTIKVAREADAADTKKKIKLLFIGAIISFAVVQIGGWAISYFTLLAAITK